MKQPIPKDSSATVSISYIAVDFVPDDTPGQLDYIYFNCHSHRLILQESEMLLRSLESHKTTTR